MMTKKDYEKAAEIVRYWRYPEGKVLALTAQQLRDYDCEAANTVQLAFEVLFENDNPRFDIVRFREACEK